MGSGVLPAPAMPPHCVFGMHGGTPPERVLWGYFHNHLPTKRWVRFTLLALFLSFVFGGTRESVRFEMVKMRICGSLETPCVTEIRCSS